ncbi:MAG: 3'(2'),5'-bisphosphate nucleotidase CysQ [Candidatus Omnitrophica bacterium]|nr:3'(2'),5'-bisphosphate nucleotidase CysQ [Candidatus Omnitrophota bacterium]
MKREEDRLLEGARAIAAKAGAAVMRHYHRPRSLRTKSDQSPLTAADLAANKVSLDGLKRLGGPSRVITEEAGIPRYERRKSWYDFWLVDPLDGTKEFIKMNGEFTVNIALIRRGRPALGVVYAPALKRMYFALKGRGAFRQTGAGLIRRIRYRKRRAGEAFRLVLSRSHRSEKEQLFLKTLGRSRPISAGSSLKFCLLAEGRAHLYPRFGPTHEWDVAAGDCVATEAGAPVWPRLKYNKDVLLNGSFLVGQVPALVKKDFQKIVRRKTL